MRCNDLVALLERDGSNDLARLHRTVQLVELHGLADVAVQVEDLHGALRIGERCGHRTVYPVIMRHLSHQGHGGAVHLRILVAIGKLIGLTVFKYPLNQLVRIEKALAFRRRPQYDGVQLLPVFVNGARERSAGLLGVARFNADGIIVDIEETVGGFKEHIGRGPASLHRDSGRPAADYRTERLVGHGIGNHFRLVGSSGMQVTVVLVEVEAMRVLIDRVRAAELLRRGVHLRNERLHIRIARGGAARPQGRAHRFGNGDGGIVARRHQQRIQRRFQRHGVAFL